jgi:hypothetical protein
LGRKAREYLHFPGVVMWTFDAVVVTWVALILVTTEGVVEDTGENKNL